MIDWQFGARNGDNITKIDNSATFSEYLRLRLRNRSEAMRIPVTAVKPRHAALLYVNIAPRTQICVMHPLH